MAAEFTAAAAGYAAAAIGAVVVLSMEHILPHRMDWRPDPEEVHTDLVYMVFVQMLLPLGLALTLAAWLQDWMVAYGVAWMDSWPHQWPVIAQFLLMLLIADLARYGLHVAAHRSPWLWRLHAVHHSPARLYWLNVGRFHPLDKTLQYLLDALPFALLGVDPAVLATYLVFYAINGFFQHSNIELRHGCLNWVIATAELHRWHHAVDPLQARCSYGNNLIVWDLVFGTRRRGPGCGPARLGLMNRDYPTRFLAQLLVPFRGESMRTTSPGLRGLVDEVLNAAMRLRMAWIHWVGWRPLV